MSAKTRKFPHPLIVALNEYAKRVRCTNADIGKAVGAEESTVRKWRKRGRSPKNVLVRAALERFVSRNGGK